MTSTSGVQKIRTSMTQDHEDLLVDSALRGRDGAGGPTILLATVGFTAGNADAVMSTVNSGEICATSD